MKTTLSGRTVPRNLIIEIIASLLLVFFIHTLVSTYIQLQSLKNLLAFYTKSTSAVAWIILVTEVIVSALVFFPRTRMPGFIAAILVLIFAAITILRFPRYPHDFGGLFNRINDSQKWWLISLLTILSFTGIFLSVLRYKRSRRHADDSRIVFT